MFNIKTLVMKTEILIKNSLNNNKVYKETIVEKHNIRIKTLTPVCVGCHDEPLSPIADYVCNKGKIHFIDQELFIKELVNKNILEGYELFISSISSQQENKHELFRRFLKENEISVSTISKLSKDFLVKDNLTEIRRHINSSDRYYIPGSTIKGAIKQALFAYKYHNSRFINAVQNSEKKKLYKDSRKYINKSESFFNAKKNMFFYDNSTFWGVEDTEFVNSDKTAIIQLDRKRLVPKKEEKDLTNLSVLQETIMKDTELTTNLYFRNSRLDKITKDKIVNYITRQSYELSYFFKAINYFTKQFIVYQLNFIQSGELNDYKEQLENYLKIVEHFLIKNNKALLCIGFGKSVLQNSIALSVKENWERLKINSPTTTFVESSTMLSIGWCMLEKSGEKSFNIAEFIDTPSKNYSLSDLSNKKRGDDVILQVQSLQLKPRKIISRSVQYGESYSIEVVGVDKSKYKAGDWIKVKLLDKTKNEPQIFKQAKLIKKLR